MRKSVKIVSLVLALVLVGGLYVLWRGAPVEFVPAGAYEGRPGDGDFFPAAESPGEADGSDAPAVEEKEFRAVWVSSVLNLDFPSQTGLSVEKLKEETIRILDGAADIGFNAVILQVRPAGDALYASDIFPWSEYLSGMQGVAPEGGFDPLAFWVDEAHRRGLELHAWINPFRVTKGTEKNPRHETEALAENNPARLHPSWSVKYKDGNLYYDPGLPETRRLVINGVAELVRNYDIDGIHYDDYFYPGSDFPDDGTFEAYGGAFTDRDDWRRDNIDKLIQDTFTTVKELNPDCRFGVSPFAIWANKASSPYGSDTKGLESYSAHFADTRRWVLSEWMDYICPQIYWNIGYDAADYEKVLDWWLDVTEGTSVDLYVGHAAYRSGTGSKPSDPWFGVEEILRQLAMNADLEGVAGSIHFRYGSFAADSALYEAVKAFYNPGAADDSLVMPVTGQGTLGVGRPNGNVSANGENYYILGSSDPAQTLYLNGEPVEGRSAGGAFGVYVELEPGENVFAFTQGSLSVTRVITRKTTPPAAPEKMEKGAVTGGFPSSASEYRRPGETVTLTCTAPIGADVTVTLDGQEYGMTPSATEAPPGGGIYATTYTYAYTLPDSGVTGKIVDIGQPVYMMTFDGKKDKFTAKSLKCLTDGAPYYAEVTAENAYVYPKASTSGGPMGELCRGQKDYITAVTNNGAWIRLRLGGWVRTEDVKRAEGSAALINELTGAAYTQSGKWDAFTLDGSAVTATRTDYDGLTLVFSVCAASAAPAAALPPGTPFSSVTAEKKGTDAEYVFTLNEGERLDGYFVSVEDGALTLNIKKAVRASGGDKPLTGIVILLDPGHGGSETGALGPLGAQLPEKTINLYTAAKVERELRALGATVYMTRKTDIDMTLGQRVQMSRALRPDLFLSIHGNSLDENVDAADIAGVSTWYRESVGQAFAKTLYDYIGDRGRPQRGVNQANLFVARPAWTPSVIIETGFLCNPAEAEWMADNAAQNRLARDIAQGIVQYFTE